MSRASTSSTTSCRRGGCLASTAAPKLHRPGHRRFALQALRQRSVRLPAAPRAAFQMHWPYDEVDIAPFLKPGSNVIAMLAHSYGRGTYQYISADAGAAILHGKAGVSTSPPAPSGASGAAPATSATSRSRSLQLGYEEFFDARLDDGAWMLPSYEGARQAASRVDARPLDSVWANADCRPAGVMPWHFVEPRGIPMLREDAIAPETLVAECEGALSAGWREAVNLTAAYLARQARLAGRAPRLKAARTPRPSSAARGPRGASALTCWTSAGKWSAPYASRCPAPPAGEVVDTQVFETLTRHRARYRLPVHRLQGGLLQPPHAPQGRDAARAVRPLGVQLPRRHRPG